MNKTVKNLMFGALLAVAIVGAVTASARSAMAANECDTCALPDGVGSGYLIASGDGKLECKAIAPQCP